MPSAPWTPFPDSPTPTTVYTQPSARGRVRWRVYVPGGAGPDGAPLGRVLIGTGEGRENEVKAAAWRAYRRCRDQLVWRSRPFDGEVEARLHELDLVCTVGHTLTGAWWTVAQDGQVIAQGEVRSSLPAYVDGASVAADALVEQATKRRQAAAQEECARVVRGMLP